MKNKYSIKKAIDYLLIKDFQKARNTAESVLLHGQQVPTALSIIAQCQIHEQDYDSAFKTLHDCLNCAPNFRYSLANYGFLLFRKNEPEEAISFICRALEFNPIDTDLFTCLNECFTMTKRYDDFISNCEVFLGNGGCKKIAFKLLGFGLLHKGEIKGGVWAIKNFIVNSPWTQDNENRQGFIRKIHFHYLKLQITLPKMCTLHSFKRKCETFTRLWFEDHKKSIEFNRIEEFRCFRSDINSKFKKSVILNFIPPPKVENKINNIPPIFICGYPKSGTTLLLSLLDNHQQLTVFPEETTFFRYAIKTRKNNPWLSLSIYRFLTQTKCRFILSKKIVDGGGKRFYDDIDRGEFIKLCLINYLKYGESEPIRFTSILESTIDAYGQIIRSDKIKYWVEKTPLNERFLPIIQKCWADFKALYIIRNPFDNFCSYRIKREKEQLALPVKLFYELWNRSINNFLSFSQKYPNKSLLLRYEDLVLDPKKQMLKICDFLNIDWNQSLLIATRNGKHWTGNSQHKTELKIITDELVGISKEKLEPETFNTIRQICNREICQFYPDLNQLMFS